ncbi:MAG TPA: carboxypeptidase-like regulatory domain-containing protein [Terracidiphilus sp.]|jgi:hypothetical protein
MPSTVRTSIFIILAGFSGLLAGQQKPGKGAVIGHVYCSDTNQPCRFAGVVLQQIPAAKSDQGSSSSQARPQAGHSYNAMSALDGSFRIEDVEPGTYYAIANLLGYISFAAELPKVNPRTGKLEAPTKPEQLQKVAIEAGQTAVEEIRLERGAAISGEVLYDDGSPGVNLSIHLYRKQKDDTWKDASSDLLWPRQWLHFEQITDDRGRYRESGLDSGEYVIEVRFPHLSAHSSGFDVNGQGVFKVYSGGSTRIHDATPVVVGSGEERTGEDLTIPLTGTHRISGFVTAEQDGHPLSHGTVALLDPDDKAVLQYTALESGAFAFDTVPEGKYLLHFDEVADVENEEYIRRYKAADRLLIVQSDNSALYFSLAELKESK